MSIPKIIHYCWFGGKPLPKDAVKCIESWKRFFPDYEIRRWDESNFDVNVIPYTQQAYSIGKYAFVSDYARMWVLHKYGGVYFDTDVEVIKSFDEILAKGGFMGFETPEFVAPGLGMALEAGSIIASEVMEVFGRTQFLLPDKSFNPKGIVPITTFVLKEHGLVTGANMQKIEGVNIYPMDWFNPLDAATGRLKVTRNTLSIHWYMKSWMDNQSVLRKFVARWSHRLLGTSFPTRVKKIIGR